MQVAKAWSKNEDDDLLRLRDEGYIWREIAKKLGRSYYSVERRARVLKKHIRDKQNIPNIVENVFYQMIKEGKDLEEIAAITGYTEDAIRQQIRLIRQLLSIDDPIKYIPSGWSVDKWKQFLYLRKSGVKNADLSVIFGRHERTLLKLYRRAQQGFYETFSNVLDKNDIGLKLGEIEKKGNLMRNTIGKKRHPRELWTEDEDKKLIALVNEGKCLEEIARQIGRTERGVSQHFPRLFAQSKVEDFPREDILSPRKRILSHWQDDKQKRVKERYVLIQQMRAEGKTAADIAVALKVSKSRAYQLCRVAEKAVRVGSGGMNNVNSISNEPLISPTSSMRAPVILKKLSPEEESSLMETLMVPPINIEDMKLSDIRGLIAENQEKEQTILGLRTSLQDLESAMKSALVDAEAERQKKQELEASLEKASIDIAYPVSARDFLNLIQRLPSLLALPDKVAELQGSMEDSSANNATVLTRIHEMECRVEGVVTTFEKHISQLFDLEKRLVESEKHISGKLGDWETRLSEVQKSVADIEDTITSPGKCSEEENHISPDFQKFLAESVARTTEIWKDEPQISPEEAKREADLLEMRGKKWTMPWKRENTTRHKQH